MLHGICRYFLFIVKEGQPQRYFASLLAAAVAVLAGQGAPGGRSCEVRMPLLLAPALAGCCAAAAASRWLSFTTLLNTSSLLLVLPLQVGPGERVSHGGEG